MHPSEASSAAGYQPKRRLDQTLVERGLVATRSQAESYIKLGQVELGGRVCTKPGQLVAPGADIVLRAGEQYVSRAALKLDSVARSLKLTFAGRLVLDVGSSTGGFTDYALRHGARRVIAVDVGTDQLHPSLRGDPRIELHEKTDIRDVTSAAGHQLTTNRRFAAPQTRTTAGVVLSAVPDVVLADVSFVSLREILPSVAALGSAKTQIVVMVKPQFEARQEGLKHKGVIKNDKMRREILKNFELWVRDYFRIAAKADSGVKGAKGNQERFYVLYTLA